MNDRDWERCIDFHGHACPGLAIGYRAAQAAQTWLEAERSQDEEVVAVVENDACGVDGIQVLLGCTFGKGNLIFRDHGKQVFTVYERKGGRGLRLSFRPPEAWVSQEMDRAARLEAILSAPADELFSTSAPLEELPAPAKVQRSVPCQACGEPTMPSKTVLVSERVLCRPCAARSQS